MVDPWQVARSPRARRRRDPASSSPRSKTAQMAEIEAAAIEHGMDVLVEVHDERRTRPRAAPPLPADRRQQPRSQDFVVDPEPRLAPRRARPPGYTVVVGERHRQPRRPRRRRRARHPLLPRRRSADAPAGYRGRDARAAGHDRPHPPRRNRRRPHGRCRRQARHDARSHRHRPHHHVRRTRSPPIRDGSAKKGDVLATARIAGIMAAKRTADLIPLCHPLPLTRVAIDLASDDDRRSPPPRPAPPTARPASRWKPSPPPPSRC